MTNFVMHGANNAKGCRFDSQGKQELIISTLSMQKFWCAAPSTKANFSPSLKKSMFLGQDSSV